MAEKKHNWLLYALVTMITWGIWGAFSDQTTLSKTMVYVIWALSMIPWAIAALINIKFKLDIRTKPTLLSLAVGLLGAGGQLVLFLAVILLIVIFQIIQMSGTFIAVRLDHRKRKEAKG